MIYGGIYPKTQSQTTCLQCDRKVDCKYLKFTDQLEKWLEIAKNSWEKTRNRQLSIKDNLKSHISARQEIYWPVLIACALLLFVFASRIAFAEADGMPNPPASLRQPAADAALLAGEALRAGNLPISDNSKLNLVGFEKAPDPVKISLASAQAAPKVDASAPRDENNSEIEDLKQDITGIVKNTPMAAMIDPISEKDRTVAAFIVGIAMKESKFGAYAPHIGGRDCYNYWGLKAGGKTTAGGYTCFSSPEDAVSVVGKTVEKMVAKGVHTPAQAISWKCGSSCAGHNPADVHKWISDVAVNFNKINS